MNTPRMRRLCFTLNWETYAGNCFKCGHLGHFMAECQTHADPSVETHLDVVQNEGDWGGMTL